QAANGSTTVAWKAPSAGSYVIMLKLDSSNFTRQSVPNPSTDHFDFSSATVANSVQGIDLVRPAGIVAELFPYTGDDWAENIRNLSADCRFSDILVNSGRDTILGGLAR